ncbi:MAG: KUP/HAK/KT family potassium transporter, partial [Gemmatimonadales bacterium]
MVPSQGNRLRVPAGLSVAALGVVYGDIGTSPLYALRACFSGRGVPPSPENVLGVLSLIFWSLNFVVSLKYLVSVMRADNRGEGGILALLALLGPVEERSRVGWLLASLGLFGAAMLYGDGVITPAISVLGAIEGLRVAAPALPGWVVPIVSTLILTAIFLFQRRGTAGIGAVFGPLMIVWFLVIAVLGIRGIVQHPRVLLALNPWQALEFFLRDGVRGFLILGAVVLVVTGGEALYADMGHFGRGPIRLAWFAVALPSLVLNYFGQGALLVADASAAANPFYALAPSWGLYPLLLIATLAAVIASQAMISGAFSMTRQAVQLGYSPRVTIVHTSSTEAGQIYIPEVNWALLIACVLVVFGFRSADGMASAYGIAVTGTMTITTVLFCA